MTNESGEPEADTVQARLAALETEVAVLKSALALMAQRAQTDALRRPPVASTPSAAPLPPSSPAPSRARASGSMHGISGVQLESFIGRYVALALGGLVMLMAVGAMIRMAVQHGLLTPEVRVGAGVVLALALAGAGFFFRRRGDERYGGVLLAIALAVVDVSAWGAGPKFGLIPTTAALIVVDACAFLLGVLALADESEFLFCIATAGALTAPFVASNDSGKVYPLLLYGAVVLGAALRAVRRPSWDVGFLTLIAGAMLYVSSATQLPVGAGALGPYAITLFSVTSAFLAMALAEPTWRSDLSRAYIATALIGILTGANAAALQPIGNTLAVGVLAAIVTYVALWISSGRVRLWEMSSYLLPLVSLFLVESALPTGVKGGWVYAIWAAFAFGSWILEWRRGDIARADAHLCVGVLLGGMAISVATWSSPLGFSAALSGWALASMIVASRQPWTKGMLAAAFVFGLVMLFTLDQLASRGAYSYVPFATRSSASAACVAAAIAGAVWLLRSLPGGERPYAARPIRIAVMAGWLIVWGRMEVAQAFSHDLSAFLLASYYAACGVGSIVAGRVYDVGRLRLAGLGLAMYAAVKAIVEVTDISSLALRVGAYGAVGIFLLGAGYLYRNAVVDSPAAEAS